MTANVVTDRQYPITVFYSFGSPKAPNVPSTDATVPVIINLPPGAQLTRGMINVTKVGTLAMTVMDNNASPESLFGSVATTSLGVTQLAISAFYPSGAQLTIAPNAASANITLEYVIAGRSNETAY
jgi:hypothetical protein